MWEKLKSWAKEHKAAAGIILGLLLAALYFIYRRMTRGSSEGYQAAQMSFAPGQGGGGGGSADTGTTGQDNTGLIATLLKQNQDAQLAQQEDFLDGIKELLTAPAYMPNVPYPADTYEPEYLSTITQPVTGNKSGTTISGKDAYHPGVVIGARNDDYMASWQKKNNTSDSDTAAIEAISRQEGVDLGIALDMFKSGVRAITGSSGSKTSSGSKSSSPDLGKGVASGKAAADNEAKLKNDSSFVKSEIDRAKKVIADRTKAGLDTSAQKNYLNRLNTGSW